ncbi:RNA polymerase sigma-70 factor, ECF subfamily [Mariniphaga anaerophila]|uniref:RNA polymerase sigma-70 factor, ECF subfamily n=1 Tax=Mariniphaga anaerophila TaxID=1484053 RepID=A0A1M4TMT0_9BACT|nr:sigma-70 family RNA polymerase sigma factor [Mariniphaga anaerophila]SHE45780.1 RNA polymerase sigma-70 factor, ECF subfamily [Mariniphaga anaerophila]
MPGIDKNEFIELFRQMHGPIRNFVYYKTGDIELADDVAQDVFAKIWEMKSKIKSKTVRSLLYTMAANLSKNQMEHKYVVFEFANNYRNNGYEASPEYEMEMKEFDERLQKAIGLLKEKDRVVFLMNRIDRLTYNQVAENLGLSVKAVEKRMKNALGGLKKYIEYDI